MVKRNIVEIELNEAEIEEAVKAYVESHNRGTSVKNVEMLYDEMLYDAVMRISDVGLLHEQKISGCKVICTEGE